MNWEEVHSSFTEGLRDFVVKWCQKHKVNEGFLQEWHERVMELVSEKIESLKVSHGQQHICPSLKSKGVQEALADLHCNYVVCPIDKATGNMAVICKRFYAQVLFKELGVNKRITNGTYVKEGKKAAGDIVSTHKVELLKQFNLRVEEDDACLPHMYWLPKKHKDPSGERFIVAAPKCSVKPLTKAITQVF